MSDEFLNTNRPENLGMVEMQLSVGQCKVIYALLWAELSNYEDKTNIFHKNTLETLYDAFEQHTRPQKVMANHA